MPIANAVLYILSGMLFILAGSPFLGGLAVIFGLAPLVPMIFPGCLQFGQEFDDLDD